MPPRRQKHEHNEPIAPNDEGKPSGWRADYVDGKWVEEHKVTKKKAPAKKKAPMAADRVVARPRQHDRKPRPPENR